MSKPHVIISDHEGIHNKSNYWERLERSKLYADQSVVCVIATRGVISARVVENWMGLMTPMNHKFIRMFISGLEVGAAYSYALELIFANPELSTWKYVLTIEEDNLLPPDAVLKLIESIEEHKLDAVGALYWTKGPEGQPMCYGNPDAIPLNFIPQIPIPGTVTPCNGLGMGATLFRMQMLKDERFPKPIFKTEQRYDPQNGGAAFTQDLWFFQNAKKLGYKFGCDSRVLVGHYDASSDIVW